MNFYESSIFGKLQWVRNEVEDNLCDPPLVREHLLKKLATSGIKNQVELNILVFCLETDDFESLFYWINEIKLRNAQLEGIILKFSQVQKIIDQVCGHESRENGVWQKLFWVKFHI